MDNYKHQDPDDDGQLPWQHDTLPTSQSACLTNGQKSPTFVVNGPIVDGGKGLSPSWKRKKQQAAAAGFKSAWEMRKASHQAKHRGYVPTASAEPATPLLDRLQAGNGPVRHIVRDGVRLID